MSKSIVLLVSLSGRIASASVAMSDGVRLQQSFILDLFLAFCIAWTASCTVVQSTEVLLASFCENDLTVLTISDNEGNAAAADMLPARIIALMAAFARMLTILSDSLCHQEF